VTASVALTLTVEISGYSHFFGYAAPLLRRLRGEYVENSPLARGGMAIAKTDPASSVLKPLV